MKTEARQHEQTGDYDLKRSRQQWHVPFFGWGIQRGRVLCFGLLDLLSIFSALVEGNNIWSEGVPKMAAVLPLIRPTGVNHHMNWETLTHAGMGSIGLPPVRK